MSSPQHLSSEKMTPAETRATLSLASIYGLRMFGMFLILPIFAIYASTLPGNPSSFMVGLALGAYGLTQALLQLPFGMASDKYGRKPMIYLGLAIFALGSLVAALASSIEGIIIGRALQGAGAVSAVVTALVADLTRDEHRTNAMATIGMTIGVAFSVSLVGGPILNQWIGVPGIFALTGVLTLAAIAVVRFVVPDPVHSHYHSDASATPARLKDVLKNKQLLRLNYGIFALHAAQMAMFVVVPFAIVSASGMHENQHWQIYLPIVLASFVLMVPAIIYAEKQSQMKRVFVLAIAMMLVAQLMFSVSIHYFWGIVASLTVYFVAFNVLEASLPSLISKIAPAAAKGTAMGVYNTAQSLGIFVGGALGGYLSHVYGFASVFIFCGTMMLLWLLLAFSMQAPLAVRTKMYTMEESADQMTAEVAANVRNSLAKLAGVIEAAVLPQERTVILKIDKSYDWDDAQVYQLLRG
ncbi:MFS transporter [Methylotenera mobilis]|uniref:Major facilitator superfamily MFS_1 n=1 Tax=Methylotenera mobilis (strain JLW8 / ATCC BAA-1282 / DSM 17540) TaxID=583345 RepID=C6WZ86_METML|nr:MFS transporter [Methylotenera mobilis]ACT49034.1 major facilitator superfamily MFS_1 [Methylotenera mobilis JLW8]